MQEAVKFLSPQQIRFLVETAEQARAALSRYVGYDVAYDATAVQLLDEWIDRHMRQFPDPSPRMRLLWSCFLGEMFRRRHGGEWAVQRGKGDSKEGKMVVLCPLGGGRVYTVDISGQVARRIARGIAASLSLFYASTSIELKANQKGLHA